jgi:hypothetical protein
VVEAQEAQLVVDKAEQKEATLFFHPLHLPAVDMVVDGEQPEELQVALVAPVAVAQKMAAQQAALEILHQHHQPKVLMAAQLLPVEPKAVLVAAVQLLREQVELVRGLQNLVARVGRELQAA